MFILQVEKWYKVKFIHFRSALRIYHLNGKYNSVLFSLL